MQISSQEIIKVDFCPGKHATYGSFATITCKNECLRATCENTGLILLTIVR